MLLQPVHGAWHYVSVVCAYALPAVVHEVQVRRFLPSSLTCVLMYLLFSYIVAACLDGGTQVISFILNFVSTRSVWSKAFTHSISQAVFGASGTAHLFPQWWGNGEL